MGTNCAPLLADLFRYPYETEFLDRLIEKTIERLHVGLTSPIVILMILFFRNKEFQQYLSEIYPKELQNQTHNPVGICYSLS